MNAPTMTKHSRRMVSDPESDRYRWVYRRICHLPRRGHDTGCSWQSSPGTAKPHETGIAVSPLKSVGGRSWSCVSPARVVAPGSAGTDSEVRGSLGTIVRHGAVLMPLSRGVCACVMVYAVFKERGEGHGGSHGRNRDLHCPSLYGFFRLFLHPLSGYFLKCSQIVFKAAWMLFETFC